MIIFEVKIGPKMDPGGLRKRVRKTVGNRRGQKGLFKASGAAKNEEQLLGAYRVDFERERRGDGAGMTRGRRGDDAGMTQELRWPRPPGEAQLSKKDDKTTTPNRI